MTRTVLLLMLLMLATFGVSNAQSTAQRSGPRERAYTLDIDRMTITEFVDELSDQTGLQVGYFPSSPEEEFILVGPVRGTYTLEVAMEMLLRPIGFTLSWINDRTVVVNPMDDPKEWGSMLVLGSRIHPLPETGDASVSLDRSELDAMGASTLADVLENLPQQAYRRPEGFRTSGEQYVDVRGLGPDATVVLINGRRTLLTATSFDANAFDLNTLPLTAVERIDVFLDMPTVAAGADAIAGVINIVLKKDIPRPLIDLRYGAAEGGATERRMSASAGGAWADDALRISGVLDYFDRGALLGEERGRWANQDFRRFGSIDQRSLISSPGNILSLSLDNLPGLPSRQAAVPHGSTGLDLTPQDFLGTAGQENRESLLRFRSVVPRTQRVSLIGSLEADLASRVTGFAELLYADRSTDMRLEPAGLNVTVPDVNAFNPFDVAVRAMFLLSEPRHVVTESDLLRTVFGVRGEHAGWQWEVSWLRTEDDSRVTIENELDPARLAAALAEPDPARAINVFQDGPGGDDALLESLMGRPTSKEYSVDGSQLLATARGEPVELPGGNVAALLGSEWRSEKASFAEVANSELTRNTTGAFVELSAPVVKGLELTWGGRIDHYHDMGTFRNARYGAIWRPSSSLSLKASYGTSVRAPSLFEFNQPRIAFPFAVNDPRRANEIANVTVVSGGNPDLQAATAQSWSAGLQWTPARFSSPRVSLDYWNIAVSNRVTPLSLPLLLANEHLFPGRVRRAPPSALDSAAGRAGVLQALDFSRENLGHLEASGIDLAISCDLDTGAGTWRPSLAATWIDEFTTVDVPGLDAVSRVNVASPLGTIPRWRVFGQLRWSRQGVSASATAHYLPSYQDATAIRGPSSRTIPSQLTMDAQVSFDLDAWAADDSAWGGLGVTVGMVNLFDATAHFAEVGELFGYDLSQGDLRERFAYLRLSKRF